MPEPRTLPQTEHMLLRDLATFGELPLTHWDGVANRTVVSQALNALARQGLVVIEHAHVHLDPSVQRRSA